MPTYEYRCKDCGHTFDAVQAFTDDSLSECPACAGSLRKVFGNVGITFKGSGFYRTDSRTGGSDSKSTNGDDGGDKGRPVERTSSDGDTKDSSKKESSSKESSDKAPSSKPDAGSGSKSDVGPGSGSKSESSAPAKSAPV